MSKEKKENPKAQKSWEILTKLINEKGLTRYKIVKDNPTVLTNTLFTDWQNGKSMPKQSKMKVIADYLGVTTDYIMGLEETKTEILEMLPETTLSDEFKEDEKEIISCYRKLTDEQKTKFRSVLLSMLLED